MPYLLSYILWMRQQITSGEYDTFVDQASL